MNYRHAFHAGNFADVLKHAVLVALLVALQRKAAPLAYVETHAGAGRYDLDGGPARQTHEFADGIARVLDAARLPPDARRYVDLVRGLNPAGGLHQYPGSPLIAGRMLRADDRLLLCELQEAECAALRLEFAGDPRVQVQQRDGYAALKALLPPKEKRALVLVDPPFEAQEAEFETIAGALGAAFQRFATGVYVVWYPIKLRQAVVPFHRWLKSCGMGKVLVAELLRFPDNSALRLNGCGMAIVNTPWQVDESLRAVLPALLAVLADSDQGTQRVEWLVRD
jgi:23S rRNA (adenine2030-N6)-methyltransferase